MLGERAGGEGAEAANAPPLCNGPDSTPNCEFAACRISYPSAPAGFRSVDRSQTDGYTLTSGSDLWWM